MKRILFYIITVVLSVLGMSCAYAQRPITPHYEELGVVPEWVKKQTSPEEYEVWKALGEYYKVDYSIVKKYRTMSDESRDKLYNLIKQEVENIKTGKNKGKKGAAYTFSSPSIKVSPYTSTALGNGCTESKYVIYSSYNGLDAHVVLTLIYRLDSDYGTPLIVENRMSATSVSKLNVNFGNLQWMRIQYHLDVNELHGQLTGNLHIIDPEGQEYNEGFSPQFIIKL